jgi:hypothetical protein
MAKKRRRPEPIDEPIATHVWLCRSKEEKREANGILDVNGEVAATNGASTTKSRNIPPGAGSHEIQHHSVPGLYTHRPDPPRRHARGYPARHPKAGRHRGEAVFAKEVICTKKQPLVYPACT